VLHVGPDHLDLERVVGGRPTRATAGDLGSRLAAMHDAGAPAWGSAPTGWAPDGRGSDGWFGPLDDPLPMPSGAWDTWAEFLAEARFGPVAVQGTQRGALTRADADDLARLGDRLGRWDTGEPPSRVHGDLWSGNVLWSARGAVLIDGAAHAGHREADLAMLALFGAPYLDTVVAAYDAVHPLARGWERRVVVHQVYPVAVHAVLFGGSYREQLRRMLRELLA
jgi:fructosamine-3-kinase